MAFPSFPVSVLWTLGSLTILWASVQSNVLLEDDPFQPVTTDETVSVGGTVTLTCRVMESDNSSLQWSNTAQQTLYFGDKRALRDNRIQLHRSTPTELSITIGEVQLTDDGDYTCSIFTKPIRTARATVTVLGVPGKPQILTNNDAVQEGGTITLICTSSGGKPAAKLRWYRGDTDLTGSTETVQADPDGRTFTVQSELQLTVTRDDNKASIGCAVDHPSLTGGNEKTETELSVLFSPSVSIQPQYDLPREGEKFFLECIGTGNPDPSPSSFQWEKKDGSLSSLVKVDDSFLRFEALNKSDNGVYLCQVDNGIGKGVGDYTLLVQGPPYSDSLYPTSLFSPSLVPSPPSASFPSSSLSPSTSLSSSASSAYSPPSLVSTSSSSFPSTPLSNSLSPSLPPSPPLLSSSLSPSLTPSSVPNRLNGLYSFTEGAADNGPDPTAMTNRSGVDHAVIGGVVAVIVFILLCLLIVLGRYLIRHKGTYLTHEAKGSDDAPDADTAIINAEGGHSGADDKKEYFI